MNLKYTRLKYKLLGFNEHQIYEIEFGLTFGLNKEQVSLYAQKQFDYQQMWEIREGLVKGLSKDKISLFSDSRFNHQQMRSIRLGLEDGLSKEEIELFADERFNSNQMDSIRRGIKDELSVNQIRTYANPKFSPEKMDNIRRRFYLENHLPEKEKELSNSNDFWSVTFSKITHNPEELEETVRIVNKEVVEEIREKIQHEILENEKNGNVEPLDFYAAVFEHFVNHNLVQQTRIYSIEGIEKNKENFRDLEEELSKNEKIIPEEMKEQDRGVTSLDIVKENAMHFLSIDEEVRNQRESKIKALKLNSEVFAYFNNQDRSDKEFITLAIKSNPKMYHFVSEDIRNKVDNIIYYANINSKITECVEEPYFNKTVDELLSIKSKQEKLRNLTCKIITPPKISVRKGNSGKEFHVMNFRVETSNKEKIYCSVFNEKIIDYKHFKEGDFLKIFGEMSISQSEDITFMNLKVFKAEVSSEKEFLGYHEPKFNRSQVSAEQLRNSVLIEDIASRKYGLSPFNKTQKYKSLQEMDSMVIYPDNTFYRFSRQMGGSVIDFVMMIEECDSKQALSIVKKYFLENNIELDQVKKITFTPGKMELPLADKDNKHVIRYLSEERKISPDVIREWIKSGRLYQDVQKNCVFVGRNEENPVYATKRSTYASFKGDVENSSKVEGIFINNQSKKLLIAESAIDAMSIQTMMANVNEYDIVCLGGVGAAKDTVANYLERKPYSMILVGLDQDKGGIEATEKIKEFINENYPLLEFKNLIVGEDCKDFNELLVKKVEKQLELQFQNEKEFR